MKITTRTRLNPALLLACALTAFGAVTPTFADPLLVSVKSTPYDRQMTRIRPVLTSGSDTSSNHVSVVLVNAWMSELRTIPYEYQRTWQTPGEVEARQPADCKGKAVALYRRMKQNGATNLRLVIGKRAPTSLSTHTWLEWTTSRGTYVLDPTFNYSATPAGRVGSRSYVPYYQYAGTRKFRALNAPVIAKN